MQLDFFKSLASYYLMISVKSCFCYCCVHITLKINFKTPYVNCQNMYFINHLKVYHALGKN